jgi:S-adenosylmethionine-diacylglycerol 3-amino-3-carboxypropyl transferase
MTAPAVRDRAAFDFIRYGSVWEDADILCEALAPVATGARLLSVASAGDNALALLTLDPAEVVAVDLNPAQLHCLELRIAAFRALEGEGELHAFLGVTPAADRVATYRRLRDDLSADARAFWDGREAVVEAGIIHAGKFERYFALFRNRVLGLVHPRNRVRGLLAPRTRAERERFYRQEWDTWRWRMVFRLFFSRAAMGRMGRDPAFFAHVEGSVAARILERSRHALTALPTETNPYLTYILTGNYTEGCLPRYLRPEHRATIRARLDRLRLRRGEAQSADGPFAGFNLSDIFEYMSPEEHERAYRRILCRAAPGARLAYWNLLARRVPPRALALAARPLPLAAELHARDNAWFYRSFHVEEVA